MNDPLLFVLGLIITAVTVAAVLLVGGMSTTASEIDPTRSDSDVK
jgi:hypothetical protein